ncbi:MAG: translocation/assembly module TamB domain-containing protein [Wenzhouxiangellaceae bacterium]|nr:translocation/assembly module TamB domain-containing protein [Wenzhouxiangellaceae bacterium]
MKRLLVYAVTAIAVIGLLAAIAWWWLTGTRSGASWLLGQVESRVETLAWENLEGGLSGGIVIEGLEFEQSGMSASIDRLELAVRIRPVPLRVTVDWLRLDGADLMLPPAAPEAPDAPPFELGDYSAPVEMILREVSIVDLTIATATADDDEATPTRIQRIALAGRYADSLVIESLELDMQPWQLDASGTLGLAAPWSMELDLDLDWALEDAISQRFEVGLRGPVEALELSLDGSGPLDAEGQASIMGLPAIEGLEGRISLSGGLAGWPGIPGAFDAVEFNASGSLENWQAELAGRVQWPEQPEAVLDLAASGSRDQLQVERGEIEVLDGRILLTGQVLLDESITFDAGVQLEQLDFTSLYPDWPSQARLSGQMDARWNGRKLQVDNLELRAPPAALRLNGSGSLDVESQALDVALDWQSLVWPPVLDDSEPLFSSESGSLQASGTLDEWRAELEAWLAIPDQPQARLELQADGDRSTANIRSGRIRTDAAGALNVNGEIGFSGPLSAQLDLALSDFDPGVFVTQLPGRINGNFQIGLDSLKPLSASLRISRLDGSVRNLDLAGSGALAVQGRAVEQADLQLSLGDNRVSLSSQEPNQWRLDLAADRLGQLWPELSGSVALDAGIDMAGARAEWKLQSAGIAWLDFRTGELSSSGAAGWGDRPNIDLAVDAVDVDLNPWERLDQVEIRLSGDCAEHRFSSYFSGTRATLELAASGELPDCLQQPLSWVGQLEQLNLSDTPVGGWQLAETLPIEIVDGTVAAGPGCLWTVTSDGRLCLNTLEITDQGRAVIAFNSVPIDLLLLVTDPVYTLGSDLKGVAELRWNDSGIQELDADLILGRGAARMLEGEQDLIGIEGARMQLRSPDPGALLATMNLRLEGESTLEARAVIPDLNTPRAMNIQGQANLDLPNLSVFNRLLPQIDRMDGRLEAAFKIDGPLDSPEFNGSIAIHGGRFVYAPLGASIEQLELTLEADEAGGQFDGGFMAGDGQAQIGGRLDLDGESPWRGRLTINGDDLRLFEVDWLELTISPDLELAFVPDRLDLNGELVIDRARLGLPPGSQERVAVSNDVEIVNGADEPELDTVVEPLPVRDIVGTVKLVLGDDVKFAAAGLETRLAGDLDIQWQAGKPMPSARGMIELVDGSYRAYGQNLEVSEGDVVFTNNPIDNPVLDIEAVRDIFGDPRVEFAGVRIRGPAQDPEISLFTTPPTTRETALAYILTGADFDHAAGQGAFSVGFWVLPNVFVSYGLGLFDTGNVLAARWELSRRWGLRATSGERDTGADVSFMIDR